MKSRLHPFAPVVLFALCLGPVWVASAARPAADSKESERSDTRKQRTDRKTSRSQDAAAEEAADAGKAGEKKADQKQAKADRAAEQAQKRTQAAKEAMTRRKEGVAAQAQASVPAQNLEGGAEGATGGAKIIHASHTVYMKDGSKLTCSLLMTGEKSVVVLTNEGELELKPVDVERVVEVEAEVQTTPVQATTQLFEGNQYLTAPQVDQTEAQDVEEPAEEAGGSADKKEAQTDQEKTPRAEPERILTIPEVPVLDASRLGLPSVTPLDLRPEPPKVVAAPAETPATVTAPAKDVTAGTAAPKVEPQPAPTAFSQPQKAKPTGKPGETLAPVAGTDAGKTKPATGDPKDAAADKKSEGGQGFTDLLKSLESQDGLNTVLEQLKNNPDFYKNIDIKK